MRTIPEISDERIQELLKRIKPLVKVSSGYYEMEPVHPRNIAFTWESKTIGRPLRVSPKGWITTFHDWGFYGLFKPSIAEVLAQISEYWLADEDGEPRVDAFWLDPDSVDKETLLWNADEHNVSGYHRAAVQLVQIWK